MESIARKQFNRYIENFEFDHLFNQLGWDYVDKKFPKKAADATFQFQYIADKAGFAILICEPDAEGKIPDAQTRKRIHTEIAKLHHEHLIIFIDKNKTTQQWELLVREANKPARTVSYKWIVGQAPELLYQKLSGAFFTIEEDEEGSLTIIDVVQRIKENFGANAEKVTKAFYTEFKKQHAEFLDFIQGIEDTIPDKENTNKQWYASLMLNRLMFCYFIQKKGFLDQDKNYLQNKLTACKALTGKGKFYSFYRSFLLELFHDGLGKPINKRSEELPVDLGKIPYLNGGLFDVHELEMQFDKIKIDDDAFERIFTFFDKWEWHLDTREHAEGRTINPDVIGYIFEKYINDRASMGAYYTKEDITDYIGKNTIIPFLFDETERSYKQGFKPESELWNSLKQSSDTYIYDAVKKGVPKDGDLFADLPQEIQAGFQREFEKEIVKESTSPHLWEMRKVWNTKAPQEIALPTEIYRELIERRKRCADIKSKIEKGNITNINDFITYNLNIRQFAQDFIESTEDPAFIRHFYKALNKITILDPTCGSGAFLFAAMNILEPLYETCIKRMEEFTEEQPGKHKFFEDTLAEIHSVQHPNLQYFIFKSIILNNLYGVDIMNEAVEIAKLRLFLKLVATVDVDPDKNNFGLEPLPDIDFNIRAGNTLIGFATEKELLRAVKADRHGQYRTDYEEILEEFEDQCIDISKAYKIFQDNQLMNDQGSDSFRDAKKELNRRLKELNENLNEYLADTYSINKYEEIGGKSGLFNDNTKLQTTTAEYKSWLTTHQPFHWFAEFYQIVAGNGGFDVIIGNPPYVVYSDKSATYKILDYETIGCANLYAFCTERSISILNEKGSFSFIIPNSSISADKLSSLQQKLTSKNTTWVSNYAWRPAKLFEGANMLLAIVIMRKTDENITYSSPYYRWYNESRESLLNNISYIDASNLLIVGSIPKLVSSAYKPINSKLERNKKGLSHFQRDHNTAHYLYYFRAVLYWVKILDRIPYFKEDGVDKVTGEMKTVYFNEENEKQVFTTLFSSSLYFLYYTVWSSCQVINARDFNIGFDYDKALPSIRETLSSLSIELEKDYQDNSEVIKRSYSSRGRSFLMEKQYFYLKKSKPIIDKIDTVLARHYGFTEEELDFIINYDIKYRMGKALFGEEDNGEEE